MRTLDISLKLRGSVATVNIYENQCGYSVTRSANIADGQDYDDLREWIADEVTGWLNIMVENDEQED